MSNIGPMFVTVLAGIIGLAIVAVVVSRNAQTPQVLSAGGNALSAIINAAVSPVSGTGTNNFGANNIGGLVP